MAIASISVALNTESVSGLYEYRGASAKPGQDSSISVTDCCHSGSLSGTEIS